MHWIVFTAAFFSFMIATSRIMSFSFQGGPLISSPTSWVAIDTKLKTVNVSSGRTIPVRVIIQECCRVDLVSLAIQLYQRFLQDDFHVYIIVPTSGPKKKKVYDQLFNLQTKLRHSVLECPFDTLWRCYDFSYKELVVDFQGYVMFANSDMFLWKPFSVVSYFDTWLCDIAAVIETHSDQYLHPGLHLIDPRNLRNLASLTWSHPKGDVGHSTFKWITQNKARIHPMMWSRNIPLAALLHLRLIPKEIVELFKTIPGNTNFLVPDFYTESFAFFHSRGGSNWQSESLLTKREEATLVFMNDRLANSGPWYAGLTWSEHGQSTTGEMGVMSKYLTQMFAQLHVFSDKSSALTSHLPSTNHLSSTKATPRLSSQFGANSEAWMMQLYRSVDEYRVKVENKIRLLKSTGKLPLPRDIPTRSNTHLSPLRYSRAHFLRDTSFYWRYVFNGTDLTTTAEAACQKKPGQKYWAATFAAGAARQKIAREHTKPSCLQYGVDEVVIFSEKDFDPEFMRRNEKTLKNDHGKGLWIWKHWLQYKMMEIMSEGDILFYIDSDFRCSPDVLQYFCLAHYQDIIGFHHSHSDYKLQRLASRDSMILMEMDTAAISECTQSSGGTIFFKKSPFSIHFIREMSSWSQQHEIACCHGTRSSLGDDWPLFHSKEHQCDQAISSLMLIKYRLKTYPWHLEGYGAASDDELNVEQRKECGLNRSPVSIHVKDNGEVSWPLVNGVIYGR